MRLDVAEEITVHIGTNKKHVDALLRADGITDLSTFTSTACAAKEGLSRENFLTIVLLQSDNHQIYGKVNGYLYNHHNLKQENYPK